MSEWRKVSMQDLCDSKKGAIAIGPFGSRLKSDSYVSAGIPVIRGTNVSSTRAFAGSFVYITEEKANALGSANVYSGDLVFPHRGAIGEVGIVSGDSYDHCVLSSSLMKFTPDRTKVLSEFLFYFFKSRQGKYELLKNASTVGTPGIGQPLSSLKAIILNLPPLPEQKAIAHILGKLDDKIELNRQMNQTLEGMAQALFKSWFVDFDPVMDNALAAGHKLPDALKAKAEKRKSVPDHKKLLHTNPELAALFPAAFVFNETLDKWVPEGWEVKRADEISDISIGKTPPRKEQRWFEETKTESNYIWVSIKKMGNSGMYISDSDEYLTAESVSKFNVTKVKADTVILSFKMTVGRVAITTKELCTNEAIAHFSNPRHSLFSGYLYQYLKLFDFDGLGSTSSIATAVNSKLIKQMPFLVPDQLALNQFEKSVKSIYKRVFEIQQQTDTLTQLRDTLLPQLISGKVRVLALGE